MYTEYHSRLGCPAKFDIKANYFFLLKSIFVYYKPSKAKMTVQMAETDMTSQVDRSTKLSPGLPSQHKPLSEAVVSFTVGFIVFFFPQNEDLCNRTCQYLANPPNTGRLPWPHELPQSRLTNAGSCYTGRALPATISRDWVVVVQHLSSFFNSILQMYEDL